MSVWVELEGLIGNKFASIKTLLSMTALEAKLTQLSVAPFLITSAVFSVVLLTLWAMLMGILGCLIWEMQHRLLWVFCSLFVLNCLMLFALQYWVRYHLRNMSFQKTRQYFKWITTLEANTNESTQTTDQSARES